MFSHCYLQITMHKNKKYPISLEFGIDITYMEEKNS